jgi:hypothetical protein
VGAGHFIYIPAVILVGIVIGWILGQRAARDAFAMELRRREEAAARKAARQGAGGRQAATSDEQRAMSNE